MINLRKLIILNGLIAVSQRYSFHGVKNIGEFVYSYYAHLSPREIKKDLMFIKDLII